MNTPLQAEPLLQACEVAALLGVDARTVARWAAQGRFPAGSVIWTLGGHRRWKLSAVRALRHAQHDNDERSEAAP